MTGPFKVSVSGPLEEFAEGFLAELAGLGYAPRSSEAQMRLMKHLSGWLATQGLAAGDLTAAVTDRFVAARRGSYSNLRSPKALVPLLAHLRRRGVAPPVAVVVAVAAADVLAERFADTCRGSGAWPRTRCAATSVRCDRSWSCTQATRVGGRR